MSIFILIACFGVGIVVGVALARLLWVGDNPDLQSELEDYRNKYEKLCEENITLKAVTDWEVDDGNEQSPNYFKPF